MLWQNLRVPPIDCGDQQVPDSYAVINGDSGATVTELSQQTLADVTSTLTSPEHALAPRKSVPDLDAILSELSGNPDCHTTFMSSVSDIDDMSYWDMDARDQFVRYEDSAERVHVKEEPKSCMMMMMMTPEPISPNTAYSDKVLERITGARTLLDLPPNLYSWTAEHTNSWARWTLEQYNLPAMHADHFHMDGTSLCMLSKTDMVYRSAAAGEYLYAELDIWKYASNLRMLSGNVGDQEIATFVDMKPVNTSMACGVDVLPPMSSSQFQNSTSAYCFLEDLGFNSETSQPESAYYCDSPAGSASVDDMDYMTSSLTASSSSSATKKSAWSSSPSSSFDSISSSDSEACGTTVDYTDFPVAHKFQGSSRHAIHLWQFLKELLLQPQSYQSCIRWLDRSIGVFKIEDSVRVARLWGARKNRPAMNYDKLSRSIRQYYKKGIIKKTTHSKRLVYQFCAPYV